MAMPVLMAGGTTVMSLSPSRVADSIWKVAPTGMWVSLLMASSTSTCTASVRDGSLETRPMRAPPMRTSEPLIRPEASSNTTVILYWPLK